MNFLNLVPILGPALTIALLVFSIVMTIAWIIVPFAIIGTKPILREILEELRAQRRSNGGGAGGGGGRSEPRL